MTVKSGVVAVVLAAGLFNAAPAAAAIVATYAGTVTGGVDHDGVFGAAGADLTGKDYIATFTYDKKLASNELSNNGISDTSYGGSIFYNTSPIIEILLKIGGIERKLGDTGLFGTVFTCLSNPCVDQNVNHSSFFGVIEGVMIAHGVINLYGFAESLPASLDQNVAPTLLSNIVGNFSYNLVLNEFYETISGTEIFFGAFSDGATAIYTVTGGVDAPGVNPVPEPSSWAMMIAGFGLVGVVARRRRSPLVAA